MVTWQIVSGLRQAHTFRGGSDYPYPFNQFVNVIEVFLMDFFTFFHTECVQSTTYADKLMTVVHAFASPVSRTAATATLVGGGRGLKAVAVPDTLVMVTAALATSAPPLKASRTRLAVSWSGSALVATPRRGTMQSEAI